MKAICDFLIEHKEEAFSYNELCEEFGLSISEEVSYEERMIRGVFEEALQRLLGQGAVEEKHIGFSDYYSYGPNPLTL